MTTWSQAAVRLLATITCAAFPLGGLADVVTQPDLPTSANSVSASLGGSRSDPEGVAPAAPSVTRIAWKDSRNADRTMVLYGYLYQYDFSFSDNNQVVTRSANDDAYGHEGFGYIVSHNTQTGNSPLGKANAPTAVITTVFAGAHHALHRVELLYDRDKEGGGNGIKIPVVIEWLVATGRDHPVWAVTWKMGSAANPGNINFDNYRMDVRGPYGSLNFDGAASRNQGDAIGGVAWGDFGLKFATTAAQLTLNSPWTYNTANTVNFTQAWTAITNAEMGIVQTRPADKEMGYPDRVVGRERGSTSADNYTNKGNCTGFNDNRNYAMPCVNGWPYQLMNYDWDPGAGKPVNEATSTKLIAWGSPYGWLGASSFDLFDYSATADGRGDRSYATFIVLGPKCRYNPQNGQCEQEGDVSAAVKAVEALAAATIGNVNPGSLVTQVPKGPGATQTKTIVNGYNDTYAAYYLSAASNQLKFTFTPAPGRPVSKPLFVVQNYTSRQLPDISVNGNARSVNTGAADSGAFVSINTAANELWVTLNETVSGAADVQIAASNCPLWYRDADGDGYGDPGSSIQQCTQPNGYVSDHTDCDDNNPGVHPGAAEVCGNGIDEDCDGHDSPCASTWYRDADGDGYGDPNVTTQSPTQPAGYVADHTDCGDNNPNVHPNAAEVCGNGIDENCDGHDSTCAGTWYRDADGDAYGDPNVTTQSATRPAGYVSDRTDCNDANASVHPGASEACGDGIDNNCNGQIDEACPKPGDADGDGVADALDRCPNTPAGAAVDASGCAASQRDTDGDGVTDDRDNCPTVANPDQADLDQDGIGDVCDPDRDGDGYPELPASGQRAPGVVYDCDDNTPAIHPGAAEICGDGIDNNCDGAADGADAVCQCGGGACGVGAVGALPLTMIGIACLKLDLVRRRAKPR